MTNKSVATELWTRSAPIHVVFVGIDVCEDYRQAMGIRTSREVVAELRRVVAERQNARYFARSLAL